MSNTDWLDRHHDAARKLRGDAQELRSLAHSFNDVGNTTMWRVLSAISFSIEENADVMQKSVGSMIMEQVNEGRERAYGMLQAALEAAGDSDE